jgi:hypothetical protein
LLVTGVVVAVIGGCAGHALDLGTAQGRGSAANDDAGDGSLSPTPAAASDASDAHPPTCETYCTPTTLTSVLTAFGISCAPQVLHVGTRDGKLYGIDVSAPSATALVPDPAGEVGFLAESGDRLFYALPVLGEVHQRSLTTGADTTLATGLDKPGGIVVTDDGVFVATEQNLAKLAFDIASQTPKIVADYAPTAPAPYPSNLGDVDGTGGLALQGKRLIVGHTAKATLSAYAVTGEELVSLHIMGNMISLAASETRLYESDNNNFIWWSTWPGGLAGFTPLVSNQFLLGGMCLQSGRLYYVAENEVRFLDVE